jgi:hypothetical protein
MSAPLPFLTAYDPPGASEGTLDPLGLYTIADQLAVQLVPAVRERMQRVRFLTAMTVGAFVTQESEIRPDHGDVHPSLVWEWLVVEALIRTRGEDPALWGVAGTQVARRALSQHGYLDARSYLKTPRIFGFHGVYKRLAMHLGLVDVHLGPGRNAERLADAWARDRGAAGFAGMRPTLRRWQEVLKRSLDEKPPRTRTGWNEEAWAGLASAFAPSDCEARERRCLRDLLHDPEGPGPGALPSLWRLQKTFSPEEFREEALHDRLQAEEPGYGPLLAAIRAYESFARHLLDAFDLLKAEAATVDARGFEVPAIARDREFERCTRRLHERFDAALRAIGEVGGALAGLTSLFTERFRTFAEPLDAGACALTLCTHHETVQRAKSTEGKRPWFDRLGPRHIYVRQAYREPRRSLQPGSYVHDFRGKPIRRFHQDLA